MKKEILTLIIGILIGAVLTSIVFMVVKPNNGRGQRPEFGNFTNFDGNFTKFDKDGNRPERPSGERPSRRSKNSNNVEENSTVKDAANEE